MKILTLCSQGNNRSVALRMHLNSRKHDTLSCGIDNNSPETLEILYKWADKIITADEKMLLRIPEPYIAKAVNGEIGDDIWGRSFHQGLIDKTFEIANKLHL